MNTARSLRMTRRADALAQINLRARRRWFVDPEVPEQPAGTEPADEQAKPTDQRTDLNTLPADVLAYIKDLRAEAKRYRDEKKQVETEKQQQERERLEADKQWETLATKYKTDLDQLTPRAERVDAMEQLLKDMAQKRINGLPKQFQTLLDPNDPIKALEWLDANESTLRLPAPPDLNAGKQGDGAGKKPLELTPEQETMRRKLKLSKEQYLKAMAQETSSAH